MSGLDLAIGGVRFAVQAPDGVQAVEDDPIYRQFITPSPTDAEGAGELRVPVTLRLDPPPDLGGARRVFDTEETWSAHRLGDDLWLRLDCDSGDWIWQARLMDIDSREPSATPRIDIHCGKPLQLGPDRVRSPLHYPLDQLLIDVLLAERRGFVCHAAGILGPAGGALFAGPSGVGKTTLSRWVEEHTDLPVVSDDRVVVRGHGDKPTLHGTPWAGEGRMALRRSAPLVALVFLHHGSEDALTLLSPAAALERLLPVASILWFESRYTEATLDHCAELIATVPAYDLHFRPGSGAVESVEFLLA